MSDAPRGPITLLREIQQKSLSPRHLSAADRRLCVEHLTGEGYSMPEVAEILQVSARTAQRDLARIREDHAITGSPEVTQQAIGQLILQAHQGSTRLKRLARDKASPPATQVEAELGAWRIIKELTELLQRLGILPTAAQELRADIHHVVAEVPSLQEMQKVVTIIEQTCGSADGAGDVIKKLGAVKGLLAQATAATVLEDLQVGEAGADVEVE